MASNPFISNKFIYQYGNVPNPWYVFYKGNFLANHSYSLKQRVSDNAFIDGDINNARGRRLLKSAKTYDVEFVKAINDAYTNDYIDRVFDGREDWAFFFDVSDVDTITSGYKTSQRYIRKWYFANWQTTQPPQIVEEERDNQMMVDRAHQVQMKSNRPYFYEATDQLEYIDYQNYVGNLEQWDSTGTITTWGEYWQFPPASFGSVSSLSDATAWEYFVSLNSTANSRKYALQMKDRFFDRDTSQTARNYLLNQLYFASTSTDTTLASGMDEVNSDGSEYRIEISSMTTNQSLSLTNISNNSGLKITWTHGSASGDLVYNSIYGKLYENSSEVEVDPSKYRIEIISDSPLYLTGLKNDYAISTIEQETIRVETSSGNNLVVKLDVLPAYV